MLTLDGIRDIQVYQNKTGYRFSVDALLLASFVNLPRVQHVADIGAGSGVIGLLLAKRYPSALVTLVELQKSLVKLAERNIVLNNLQDRVSVIHADIKESLHQHSLAAEGLLNKGRPELPGEPYFDLVVSNPPFRPLKSGKLSTGDEKAVARHEISLPLKKLVAATSRLLRHHGRFCMIHLPERIADINNELRLYGCEAKRIRFVHSRIDTEAKMVLVEAVKGSRAGLTVEPPLFLYSGPHRYSPEVMRMYQTPSGETT